ncbi:hypothetical protein BC830DRAFT_1175126 [Chytriomyces sp. MP71]|nr:hypothetical protein BC830DRAFT_1175126 [Chytriomyces sp. MP71]
MAGAKRVALVAATAVILCTFLVLDTGGIVHPLNWVGNQANAVDQPGTKQVHHGESHTTQETSKPRILYYNVHPGTQGDFPVLCLNALTHGLQQANFKVILTRLDLAFSSYNPYNFGYGMNASYARQLIAEGKAREFCDSADIIVVSDTCPHARFLLETFLDPDPANHCSAKIALELTNRFDWGYEEFSPHEHVSYRAFMWRIVAEHADKVFWVANNPLEPRQVADMAIATPLFRLLRPIGYSEVPALEVDAAQANLPMVRTKKDSPILKHLDTLGVKYLHVVQGVHSPYGGPKTAAKYRAFVEFPYQASTMKLYENIAAGVTVLVPSPKFYFELIKAGYFSILDMRTSLLYQGQDWPKYHDYYSDDMKPYIYYFDSFEHLKDMLDDEVDIRNVRTNGPAAFSKIAQEIICGWADLFIDMGFPDMTLDGKPYEYGQGPTRYRETLREGVPQVNHISEWEASYQKSMTFINATHKAEWNAIQEMTLPKK